MSARKRVQEGRLRKLTDFTQRRQKVRVRDIHTGVLYRMQCFCPLIWTNQCLGVRSRSGKNDRRKEQRASHAAKRPTFEDCLK